MRNIDTLYSNIGGDPMPTDLIRYVEPVFRPPSEAESLILPLTDGCSWNRCTFCEMYTAPQKRFRPRSEDEVLESIKRCGQAFGGEARRVFLADGDAMTLSTRRLVTVLEAIRREMPAVRRVSSYCLPRNLRNKTAGGAEGSGRAWPVVRLCGRRVRR